MRRAWLFLILVLIVGCEHADPPPPVPPPPEDLSTWSVLELVQPTPPVPDVVPVAVKEQPVPGEKVYAFTPGTTFAVTVAVPVPLDVMLEPGEQVRNIVGGDRAPAEANQPPRWDVKEGGHGTGDTFRPHIFLTVTEPGLTTGVIITTTKRTYYLACKSVATSRIRAVRWRYAPDAHAPAPAPKVPGLLPDPTDARRYHTGYVLTTSHPTPVWAPRQVVDDGKKVYIIYPEVTLFDMAPMLRLLGPNGPQLMNARQFLNVVIVDQLVARAELRVGIGEQAETVTITRAALRTIECPGDPDCPVWPTAAAVLVRRQP